MRKKIMKEEQETITQYLKYTVNKDSDEGILLEYLKLERYEPLSRLILQAVMSYWLPLALEKQEDYDQNKLKKWAEQSIYVLRRQADYFACKFGIDLDERNLPFDNNFLVSRQD